MITGREVIVYDPEKLERDERYVRSNFVRKLRRVLSRIPFAREVLAAWYCARDPATPTYVRAVLMGALAYFVLPTDWVPDFIAVFGFTDDATVLYAALRTVSAHVTDRHRTQAESALKDDAVKLD